MKQEYNRQKTLSEQNAGTGKVFEKTKADFDELNVELSALELQLKMLNVNTKELSAAK